MLSRAGGGRGGCDWEVSAPAGGGGGGVRVGESGWAGPGLMP